MPLEILHGDITQVRVDAIVNAASTSLKKRPGICEAVFQAAGEEQLKRACRRIRRCAPGYAVITPGFALPARFIIHAARPDWFGSANNARRIMASCYYHAMTMAAAHRCKSLAFPLLFSGDYAIPRGEALKIAVTSIRNFLEHHPSMEVFLILYGQSVYDYAVRTYKEKA